MATISNSIETLRDDREIMVRSPEVDDAQNFVEYCRKIFNTSDYIITEPDEFVPDVEKQAEWIRGFEGKSGSVCIIAEYNDQIIGNLDFRNREGRRRIRHRGDFGMGVLHEWRRQGVGKLLVQRLIEWAKLEGNPIEKIELMVLEENHAARALYKSLGFVEEGRIYREVRLGEDRYIDGIPMGLWLE